MKIPLWTLAFALSCTLSLSAQEQGTVTPSQADNTIEGQFMEVVDESNDYQDYKVIKKFKINKLRQNILDTIASLEGRIDGSQTELGEQAQTIDSLTLQLRNTKEELAESREKENGIEILGILTEKATYNTLMWTFIGILLVAIAFLGYKFKNSHAVTKEAQLKLAETEIELETHRQKALEREQKLRRKLQDEINKKK
jgi:hypothetical protein